MCLGIYKNLPSQGGYGTERISLTKFEDNVASGNGGGICVTGEINPELIGNLITGNSAVYGAGVYLDFDINGNPIVNSNTIADNPATTDGGGLFCSQQINSGTFENNIIWGNKPNSANDKLSGDPTFDYPLFSYCDIEGYNGPNYGSPKYLTYDPPDFLNSTNEPYRVHCHASPASPCIDHGDNSIIPTGAKDIRGYDRIIQISSPNVDMGAYEHDDQFDIWIFIPGELTALNEQTNKNQNISVTCYPNPFVQKTNIDLTLPDNCKARIEVFNAQGQLVELLADDNFNAGKHSLIWNVDSKPKGLYFCKVTLNNKEKIIQKLMVE